MKKEKKYERKWEKYKREDVENLRGKNRNEMGGSGKKQK